MGQIFKLFVDSLVWMRPSFNVTTASVTKGWTMKAADDFKYIISIVCYDTTWHSLYRCNLSYINKGFHRLKSVGLQTSCNKKAATLEKSQLFTKKKKRTENAWNVFLKAKMVGFYDREQKSWCPTDSNIAQVKQTLVALMHHIYKRSHWVENSNFLRHNHVWQCCLDSLKVTVHPKIQEWQYKD